MHFEDVVHLGRVDGVDDGLVFVASRRPVVVEIRVVVRPGFGEVEEAWDVEVDFGIVAACGAGDAAAAQGEFAADGPLGGFEREEVRVLARNGADREEPDVVGRSELKARTAHLSRRREQVVRSSKHAALGRTGVAVRRLVLVERRRVGVGDLHRIAGDEHGHRVRVPGAAVLAALERPAHAVGILFHPIDVDAPRRVGSLTQREDAVVLRAVGIKSLVLVVVGTVFILLRRSRARRYDWRRPETLRGVSCSMGGDRLADMPRHLHDVRLADFDDLDVLERRV